MNAAGSSTPTAVQFFVADLSSVPGFAKGSSSLSTAQRASIVRFLKSTKGVVAIDCVGSTEGPTILNVDARLAMKRGSAVCAVAKSIGMKVRSVSYVNRVQVGTKFRSVELRLIRRWSPRICRGSVEQRNNRDAAAPSAKMSDPLCRIQSW